MLIVYHMHNRTVKVLCIYMDLDWKESKGKEEKVRQNVVVFPGD